VTRSVAILTPAPHDLAFESRWRDVLEHNAAPLRRAGFEVESRAWTEAGDLAAFDLVLPLLVWGYHRDQASWLARTAAWEAQGVRLFNAPPVLRWNAEKSYLGRLAERGAPVVPTAYVDRISEAALRDAAAAFGTDRVVAKPLASSTAWRTIRWPGDPIEDGPEGAAMIQPYLPRIESDGEISLLYFGGRYGHAVGKRPRPGEYRVQPEYDGIIARHEPSGDEMRAAEAILAAVDEPLLYARIDLVRGLDGRPALIELELIEPDLYLGYDPARGASFAQAVCAAAG
jgi:glutathione synthase/RimK-type ligase-like ATP-grasp enzyme